MREVSWRPYALSDLADMCLGKMLDQKKNKGEFYPYLANLNVQWGKIDLENLRKMKFEPTEFIRYGLNSGDIVMCEGGEPGRCAIWKEQSSTMMIQKALHRIRAKNIVDNYFLYYSLLYKGLNGYLDGYFTGSAIKHLTGENLAKIVINIPPLPTQRKIASILSAYDDLIENNLRRIKLLEEKAQLTYEEWFVRMKFPGHETTPVEEETGLPEGWERDYFKGILNFKTGKLDSNALVVDGLYDFYTCAKEVYKTNTFCFEGEAVLLGGNNATGDFALFYANDKFDAYQRTYIVTPVKQSLPLVYVFFYLKKLLPYFQIVSSGASTKFLTMKILNKTKILVPDLVILNKFSRLIKPCFDSILLFKNQNQLLQEARDILLPRLMTGVIDLDKIAGQVVEEISGRVGEAKTQ